MSSSNFSQDFSLFLPPSTGHRVSGFVISCWFLSLLLSISCALVALSLRRWAQPCTWVASPRYSLLEQARLRTLLADRNERLNFAFLVGTLHGLVHISFSVFLFGLFPFLWHGLLPFSLAILWIVLSIFVYAYFTALPLSRTAHPFRSPLINFVMLAISGFYHGIARLFYLVNLLIRDSEATQGIVYPPSNRSLNWYLDFAKFAEERVQELASCLDDEVLRRTFDMLRSDDDLEQFFEAIPGFLASEIVENPRRSLDILFQQRLAEALVGFCNRTMSSNRVSESVKGRRLIVCIRVIEVADLSIAVPWTLHLFSGDLSGVSGLVEMGHSLGIRRNGNAAPLAQVIIARIISINYERDERWSTLAMKELDISEDTLRRYLAHGDSISLTNLIHITRQFFDGLRQHDLAFTRMLLSILPSVSKFNISNTLPELQHEFCALWNEIVEQARISGAGDNPFMDILVKIQGLYVALHETDAARTASAAGMDDLLASYPPCIMPDHRIQEVAGSITCWANHSTTATSPISPPHTPTSIVQVIADASLTSSTSMAQPIALYHRGTGDAPRPDEEITVSSTRFDFAAIRSDYFRQGLEHPPFASTIALSDSIAQAATIADPNITRRTSLETLRENGNAQDIGPTIQTKLTHHGDPGRTGPSVVDANYLGLQDYDSSEISALMA